MRLNRICAAALAVVGLFAAAAPARAALVNWDINSAQSYLRLNLPANTNITLEGQNVTVRVRNAANGTITDTTGGRAFLDGTIATSYVDGSSIQFLSGSHGITAIESGSFRPNPAAFNPLNTNADNPNGQYGNTTGAPAAFAARVNIAALFGLVNVTGGYLALRDVMPDIASGVIGIGGGTIAGSSTSIGSQAFADIDGENIALIGSQPIPDTLAGAFNLPAGTNVLGGTVSDLGGLFRGLTLNINVPLAIDLGEGIILNASVTGVIVATTELVPIPEPSSVIMASFAALGLCWAGRRRFRRA